VQTSVFRFGERIVSPSDLHEIGWGFGQRIGCENVRVDGPLGGLDKDKYPTNAKSAKLVRSIQLFPIGIDKKRSLCEITASLCKQRRQQKLEFRSDLDLLGHRRLGTRDSSSSSTQMNPRVLVTLSIPNPGGKSCFLTDCFCTSSA
jgi:hypothetical protein